MKTKKMLFYLLAGLLGGCVPVLSLHPLYDDQHIVFEEKLIGTFRQNDEDANTVITWEFTRANEPNTYSLIYSGFSKKDPNVMSGLYNVLLVKLDNGFFLDVYPKEAPWGNDNEGLVRLKWPMNSFFILPAHTFIKVEIFESELKIRMTDDDNLKKLLKSDPNAVKYEIVDNTPVLTAPTKQLQPFVLKYTDQLFDAEVVLTRKTSEPASDFNEPKPIQSDANSMTTQPKVKTQ